jgi:hypothetical protein
MCELGKEQRCFSKFYSPRAQDTTGVKQYSDILTLRAISQQCSNTNNINSATKKVKTLTDARQLRSQL